MPITLTNQVASQALRGQNVKVTLDSTDAAQLPNINIGDVCTISTSSNTGTVFSIDTYGNSFEITPTQPNLTCIGSVDAYLAVSDTVTI
jgi:hypothetical protein